MNTGHWGNMAVTDIQFLAIVDLVEWNSTGGSGQKTRWVIESVHLKLSGRYAGEGQSELPRKGGGGGCPLREGLWS